MSNVHLCLPPSSTLTFSIELGLGFIASESIRSGRKGKTVEARTRTERSLLGSMTSSSSGEATDARRAHFAGHFSILAVRFLDFYTVFRSILSLIRLLENEQMSGKKVASLWLKYVWFEFGSSSTNRGMKNRGSNTHCADMPN